MAKGISKGFKNETLTNQERVKVAIADYIKAISELNASVELGYIDEEFKNKLIQIAQKDIDKETNKLVKALKIEAEEVATESLESLLAGI